ncbi:uncharacterized [Lates japonicus]
MEPHLILCCRCRGIAIGVRLEKPLCYFKGGDSGGKGVESLGGPEPISRIILACGLEPLSHCPSLPSCLNSGPSLQCRMGDNLLIARPSARRTIKLTLSAF